MAQKMLLKGGTCLIHDEDETTQVTEADIMIEGSIITKIEADILASADTKVIDCTNKIVSPGFIDTHHHVWQTLLKGRHSNDTLLDYLPKGTSRALHVKGSVPLYLFDEETGNFTSEVHTPADLYWGQLGGCLAMLDAGTTTVVDHAHMNYEPDSSKAALSATIASGIRSVFCYCPTPRATSWSPFELSKDLLPPWVTDTLSELASKAPLGDGRVTLGLAFDGIYLPKDVVVNLFTKAKDLGVKLITMHYVRSAIQPGPSPIETLHSYSILDSTYLFSHTSNPTPLDAEILHKTQAHTSTTPSTEFQMCGGPSAAFHPNLSHLLDPLASLGVDCHSNNHVSIPAQANLLLQHSRANYMQKFDAATPSKYPKKVSHTVAQAFNLTTIGGARAANLSDKIGSLRVGKEADILIFDTMNPTMVCAAQHDPVTAIIMYSGPRDIETVIVGGKVRKEGGKLVDVHLDEGAEMWVDDGVKGGGKRVVSWEDVSRELVGRREEVQRKIEGLDMEEAFKGMLREYHIDESVIVDSV